jgi:hypothetical protein
MQPIVDLAALLAQVQQLTQTVQAMQAQNEALQDQLDAQLVAVPVTTPVPIPAPVQVMKIATPDPYDGSSDQTKHFLHQCEVYFLGLPGLTEHQHMTFTISYMNKGSMLLWAEWIMEEVMLPGYVTNWRARMESSDLDHVTMAHLKIKEVKQGKESMDDYVEQFLIMQKTQIFVSALNSIFCAAMNATTQVASCLSPKSSGQPGIPISRLICL